MNDQRAEREALAERILADARARAATVDHGAARASILRAADRRAESVRAGVLPLSAGVRPYTAPAVSTRPRAGRILRGGDGEPVPTTLRSCLRCRKDFDSTGPGNRMCDPCRAKMAEASPYAV